MKVRDTTAQPTVAKRPVEATPPDVQVQPSATPDARPKAADGYQAGGPRAVDAPAADDLRERGEAHPARRRRRPVRGIRQEGDDQPPAGDGVIQTGPRGGGVTPQPGAPVHGSSDPRPKHGIIQTPRKNVDGPKSDDEQ